MKKNIKKPDSPAQSKQPLSLNEKLLFLFKNNPTEKFTFKMLHKEVGLNKYTRDELGTQIDELKSLQLIVKIDKNKFILAREKTQSKLSTNKKNISKNIIEGVLDVNRSGSAYCMSQQSDKDVFIPSTKLNRSLDGDRVQILVKPAKKGAKRLEGEVINIIERHQLEFVGIIKISERHAFLIPDKLKMKVDLFIPPSNINGAKDGEKVLVKIVEWNEGQKSPVAQVVKILGKPGENEVEMLSILADKGFPLHFSPETLHETELINTEISEADLANRLDYRSQLTFTIDPIDAKDFDDALSFVELKNGNYEIGVHIADVSHYVKPNSALDIEAFKRSTSVYLVDRVLPMLPEKISNELCSLRPNEDKLCFSVIFEMDKNAKIKQKWFGKTIIHSKRRFYYEEAQHILDSGEGHLAKELKILNEIAKKLRENRFKDGSINFNSTEIRFKLDDKGKPIEVYVKESLDTNKLIEDFMLLANRTVAEFVNNKKISNKTIPFPNRIHDKPDLDKLLDFRLTAESFGYKMKMDTPKQISNAINELMSQIIGTPEQHLLETLAIRSMAKAVYSTENIGHYGLGFNDYAHFTSPIRRYPDVMVHRILEQCLTSNPQLELNRDLVEKKCEHCSAMERKAMDCERESTKYKQVEYMSQFIGVTFNGVISGVVDFGFFVEIIDNKCEGLIRIDSLKNDYYIFEETQHAIIGYHSGVVYRLGSPIKVKVIKTDLITRTIDFEIV